MAYNVSDKWKNKVYSGEKNYMPYLFIDDKFVPVEQISRIEFTEDVIDNSSQTMYIGTFRSNQIDIKFKSLNGLNIKSNLPVYLEMGLNTDFKEIEAKYFKTENSLEYFRITNPEDWQYLKENYYINILVNNSRIERVKIVDTSADEIGNYLVLDLYQISNIKESDSITIYPYEYIPKGHYLIDELNENYYQTCQISCLDYAVTMKTNVDYSGALDENGEITLEELLKWLCNYYNVSLGAYPNINRDMKISSYDSTLSGKTYISYIAEMMGGNAKFNRNNQLCIFPLINQNANNINGTAGKDFKSTELYKISRVYYTDGSRLFEYGEKTNNTLQIRQENMFVVSDENIENIFNSLVGTEIWSLEHENYGDISLDCWDTLDFAILKYDGETPIVKTYKTINNCKIVYELSMMTKISTKIPTKQQQETTNVVKADDAVNIKKIQTEINQLDGSFKVLSADLSKVQSNINNNFYTKGQVDEMIVDAEGITNTFTTTGGDNVLKNTGLWYRTDKTIENSTIGDYKELEYWEGNALYSTNERATNTRAISLLNNIFSQKQSVKNGTYTLSFTYKKIIELSKVKVSINGKEEELLSTEYTTYENKIEVTNNSITIQFDSDTNNSCLILDLMLNVGDIRLPYNQNQNEITTDTVQISKGITIRSSDTESVFKANSTGIRVTDTTDNTTTEFTNIGMSTKKAKMEQAEAAKILIQRVGEQTWISWIGSE